MYVLGIDTSTEACSTALLSGGHLIAEMSLKKPRRQAELLAPMISELAKQAEVELKDVGGVAVTIGPGSFTGLRVGLGVAKGFCYSGGLPIVGIPTLAALAKKRVGDGPVCALVDARIKKVYVQVFQKSGDSLTPDTEVGLLVPEKLPQFLREADVSLENLVFVGDGIGLSREVLKELGYGENHHDPYAYPRAADVAYLGYLRLLAGDVDDPSELTPLYLAKSRAERLLKGGEIGGK